LEPIHANWGDVELGTEIDEGGDPPRIWSPHGDYPGTAFTRSLGDAIAEELGVFSEPEMITRTIDKNDRMIVIASDGVFEFLTNQSVVDMCCKFTDPLEACRNVVSESYELWLQYELRTDDITMIAIFVDGGAGEVVDPAPLELDNIMLQGVKPARMNASRQHKKAMVKARGVEEDVDFDIQEYTTVKTDHEKSCIAEAIKASFLFQNISCPQVSKREKERKKKETRREKKKRRKEEESRRGMPQCFLSTSFFVFLLFISPNLFANNTFSPILSPSLSPPF